MARRKYKAGSKKTNYGEGIRSPHRAGWLKSVLGEITLLRFGNEDIEGKKEPGPNYRITIFKQGFRIPVIVSLTNMTADELEAIKEFLILTYKAIKPIIEDRDRNANEAAARGDDSFDRVYRPLPQVVIRERTFTEDNQSLHDGLAHVLELPWVRGMRDVGVGRAGDDLADDEQEGGGSEDDGEEADESS